jgi:tetratricopeptide (TPR) repeat protein
MYKKSMLVLFGLAFALILLEAGMRLAGFVYLSIQERGNIRSLEKHGTYRIMCIGESTTQGQYPKYLEEELSKRYPEMKFSVIDKGRAGCNTNFIVLNMDSDLDKYAPDMVISMMGINYEIGDAAFENSSKVFLFRSFKVYKLMRLLRLHIISKIDTYKNTSKKEPVNNINKEIHDIENNLNSINIVNDKDCISLGNKYEKIGMTAKAEGLYKKAIKINPNCYDAYIALGYSYTNGINPRTAEKMFQQAIVLDPKNENGYVGLGNYYVKIINPDKAEKMFRKAIEINPENEFALSNLGDIMLWSKKNYLEAEKMYKKAIKINPKNEHEYLCLGYIYGLTGRYKEAENMYKKASEANSETAIYNLFNLYLKYGKTKEAQEILNRSFERQSKAAENMKLSIKHFDKNDRDKKTNFNNSTMYNYIVLRNILKERRVKYVCMQYPMRDVRLLKYVFDGDKDIVFVDNEKAFKDVVLKDGYGVYFRDSFAGDFGHCTDKGNQLLARNISDVLVREVFSKDKGK